ncbi:hypothetical protein DMP15_18555 [Pseudonocardia sp. UM4_GMWB1]|uniref:hypothetical protein n=1 Tax=Pseudonocardia sp. UM4_GMWB1 TaxID=2212989 RepID=UPI00307E70EE
MPRHRSSSTSGNAPCRSCGAASNPHNYELHTDACTLLEASRARRNHDLAALADHPDGHLVVRPVDESEVDEIADAVGRRVPTGAGRARWTVAVMQARDDHAVALARAVLVDGQPVAALVDETPADCR